MKNLIAAVSVLVAGSLLSGCFDEEAKTVDWWKDHDAERSEFVAECRNDAQKEATANCQNAIKADLQIKLVGKEGQEDESPSIH